MIFCTRILLCAILIVMSSNCFAMNMDVLEESEDAPDSKMSLIPYAFYNGTTDAAGAVAMIAKGYFQPQSIIVANAFYSTNSSHNLFLLGKDFQAPFFKRLFVDGYLINGEWGLVKSYRDGNPDFPGGGAGSNFSSEDNYIEAEGGDDYYRLTLRFLLPIGHGKGDPIHKFVLDKYGMLVPGHKAGGNEWNPFTSGRTTFDVDLFHREQDLVSEAGDEFSPKTTGFVLALEYDNTDYRKNPSNGSRQRLGVSRDWGLHDEYGSEWTTIDFEYSKYYSFGPSEKTLQRVLAFNAWFIDTPTWDDYDIVNGQQVFHRPPHFAGATLGGIDRQRAYPAARFNDRSAVNYALEYRHMPTWNPFPRIPLINKLRIPWWQWVGLLEIGRVHNEFDLDELHGDMNWSVGAGLRLLVEALVVRVDYAVSDEQSEVQMFIGQTF
jgi:hypothetical protein